VRSPYDRQRQPKSKTLKTNIINQNPTRIPFVPRPSTQPRPSSQPPENNEPSLVIPLPLELSQLETSSTRDSEHNTSDEAGNPFECLASFYFPEHVEFTRSEDPACVQGYQCAKSIWMDIPRAEEEIIENTEKNNDKNSTSNVKNELNMPHNQSEVMTSVPNLMKILQAKSQKKIFLEERK